MLGDCQRPPVLVAGARVKVGERVRHWRGERWLGKDGAGLPRPHLVRESPALPRSCGVVKRPLCPSPDGRSIGDSDPGASAPSANGRWSHSASVAFASPVGLCVAQIPPPLPPPPPTTALQGELADLMDNFTKLCSQAKTLFKVTKVGQSQHGETASDVMGDARRVLSGRRRRRGHARIVGAAARDVLRTTLRISQNYGGLI